MQGEEKSSNESRIIVYTSDSNLDGVRTKTLNFDSIRSVLITKLNNKTNQNSNIRLNNRYRQ